MTDGHQPPLPHGNEQLPEGEEQAPPGTRTMAIVRWSLVALMALAAVAAWVDHAFTSGSSRQAAGEQYLCPMHPQIVTTYKGECPICGMDLVPADAAKGGGDQGTSAAGARYTCPMHPAFVTEDPKVRCPDCGMKLVLQPSEEARPAAAPAGPPIPGLAPVELSTDRVQLIGMRSVPAVRETLASSIRSVGFVAANESSLVSINVRFSGWVEQLSVGQTGQLVQKGEVLAAIYSPEMLNAQQVFLNAVKWTDRKPGGSAQAPAVANDLERDARLRLELLGVAPQDIDAIAAAGQPLRAINVRSPVRGYVSRKSVLRGLYVQAGNELFQLADLSTVWVLVDVYESEIPRIRTGQQATFELKAYPGKKFPGRVQFIYPALNTGSRTLQARVELRNPALELKPGMFGDVTLDLGAAEAVVVPSEALIDTGEHRYVFVDRGGGRYEPRPVQAGASSGGRVAILAGLAAGERVVTTANFLLDSESRLRAAVEGFSAAPAAAPGHEDHGRPAPMTAPGHGGQVPTIPSAAPDHQGHGHAAPMASPDHQGHGHAAPTPAPAAPAASAPTAAAPLYTCQMHPQFVTPQADARCPSCGMKLVPKPASGPAPAMKMPPGEPMQMPAGQPMQMPAGQPVQMPAGEPMQMPAGQPMQMPAGQPMQMPAGQPMQMPAGEPMQMAPGEPPAPAPRTGN